MSSSPRPLNVALVGTGRMGQEVEAVAIERGHMVTARFDASRPLLAETRPEALAGADVVVDFSAPDVALDHIHRYCLWGVDAVIGTTGWSDDAQRVRGWVQEGGNGLLVAANFSLGVALLARAMAAVMPLLDRLDEYDPSIHETHHARKVDSPSGTALRLADILLAGLSRKNRVQAEAVHGAIEPGALHVTSTRTGHVVGEHAVAFDGPADRIVFTHEARDRRAFAAGAVRAAEWLHGRAGLFTFDHMIDEWLGG